ncbi:MAG: hypothetical protein BIFFINMI_03088 [Phycisphaerae bacterium]|nr:hypothetical protein [Phycisphaerae bacterium]
MRSKLVRSTLRLLAVALAIGLAGPAAQAQLNVPLTVTEHYGETRTSQPVTSGVPLPEGAFKDVDKLRLLDADGNEVPCQFAPTVRWFRDRSVRWVLLDFQASQPAFTLRQFSLRDDGPAKPIENPIVVEDQADRIVVTTGPLRFAVRKKNFNLVDEAWLDDSGGGAFDDAHRIVSPSKSEGAMLWSNSPNLPAYRLYSSANDPDCQVAVEEAGPMRVVIKAVGRHLPDKPADASDKLLDYVIRIHAYRGQSYLRVVYAAECKQGPSVNNFTAVDRWNVAVNADLGKPDELTYRFGNSGSDVTGTFGGQDRAWLLCESADRWEVGGAAYHHATEGVLEGQAMSIRPLRLGYVDLSGPQRGVMVSVRWFWQNNPKGLFVHPNGSIEAGLWPSLVRKTATVTGFTSDRQAHFFPGMSKTHDLLVYFHSPAGAKRLAELHAFCQQPLFAACRPAWYCQQTRAFGRVASADANLYPESIQPLEANYDIFFELNRRAIDKYRDFNRGLNAYGIFNFGDSINHVNDNRRDKNGERPDPTDIHWDNEYYGFPHAMLIQFARTGNLDMLEMAEQASTHLQDTDILCWHPDPRFAGAPRYSAGLDHVRIYGNGDPIYTSNTYNHYKNQSLFERFWLEGDRRALEMGLLSAGFARTHTTDAISQSRSIGHGIIGLLSAYETTLDSSYLAAAEKIVNKTRGFRKSSSGAWIDGIALEGHRAWYEITGDAKAIETVIGGVDAALAKNDLAGAILQAVAFAYGQTGDKKYLDATIKGLARNARGVQNHIIGFGNSFRSTGYTWWYLSKDLPRKEDVPVLDWKK